MNVQMRTGDLLSKNLMDLPPDYATLTQFAIGIIQASDMRKLTLIKFVPTRWFRVQELGLKKSSSRHELLGPALCHGL